MRFHRRTLPGAPPGMLVPDPAAPGGQVQVIAYGPDRYVEQAVDDLRAIQGFLDSWPVTWVNVDGVGDTTVISEIGRLFGFHRLALEDVVHVHQRAKVDQYGSHFFIVARMPLLDGSGDTEQLGAFLGDKFVVTFQEREGGDCFDPVRLRIRTGVSALRRSGPDHLMYALLDSVVDHYFPLIERVGDQLEELEAQVLRAAHRGVMFRLHEIKRTLLAVRRAVWPLRDAINTLIRDSSDLISNDTRIFLRDCHDHTVQIIDLVEAYRDLAAGLQDAHLSTISYRINETMRVLTVISTIFIPLTFIAGIYGMNFDAHTSPWNMPELEWYWGYPLILLLMLAVAGALLGYFWRKGWLGARPDLPPPDTDGPSPDAHGPSRDPESR